MRSTSHTLLLCLPACRKPNTDIIIIFFFFSLSCNILLFYLTGSVGKFIRDKSCSPPKLCPLLKHYRPTLENMTVWTSHKAYQIFCAGHGHYIWFKSKPKGVFMNRQQVIRSANVGSVHLNRTNIKFTWCKHRITNNKDKMQSYFITSSSLPWKTAI